jgi:hypothetical protein
MKYEQAQHLKLGEFKRFWGVKLETFKHVQIVQQYSQRKKKTGRPRKINLEDQVLMTLEYWREYRTYFHIGQSWGVTESTTYLMPSLRHNQHDFLVMYSRRLCCCWPLS